jgi:membrane protease subunit (stomatin/prohibitin family)
MSAGNQQKKQQKQDAKQTAGTWNCACGTSNATKFCGNCGKPQPAEVICTKCKWKRPAEQSSMKFCGECGTQFPV